MKQMIMLASGSPYRKTMLAAAGIEFATEIPRLDERAVEDAIADTGVTPSEVALILAEAKATAVSERHAGTTVIGCDQTLALDERILHKPSDMEGARQRLLALSGKTHDLNSAVVMARDGVAFWRHVGVARMTMRPLDPAYVGRHLAAVGEQALTSVGAYQIEGRGVQLFSRIEGDHFTIVGLPLLPLLAALRAEGAIDG